jgi:alanine dehydrogenase
VKVLSAADVARAAPYRELVEALREGFRSAVTTPVRHHHETSPTTTLLLMPAWSKEWTGIKVVTFKSDNAAQGLPTIHGSYLLIDNKTGAALTTMDGTELTRRRTAAASALAADYLARPDASVLIHICNRTSSKADSTAAELRADGFAAHVSEMEVAVRQSDIVCGITSSTEPLIRGAWIRPGTHIDLAGAFKPTMRETDGDAVAKASVYVDTYEGAKAEAGDLLRAEAEGKFSFKSVKGDLAELCGGKVRGRQNGQEVTLFKSCGTALEDLAAAILVHLRS